MRNDVHPTDTARSAAHFRSSFRTLSRRFQHHRAVGVFSSDFLHGRFSPRLHFRCIADAGTDCMSKALRTLVGTFSGMLCVSCATAHSAGDRATIRGSTSSDVVVFPELTAAGRGKSLLSALQVARPGFLNRRGAAPLVSIDGGPASDQSVLRLIPVGDVYEVRLLRASSGAGRPAVLPNGDVVVADVLFVVTRRQ